MASHFLGHHRPAARLRRAAAAALVFTAATTAPAADVGVRDAVLDWIASDQVIDVDAGTVIGHDGLGRLAAVLPPAFLDKLDFPDVRIEIGEHVDLSPHDVYVAASTAFAGESTLAPDGKLTSYTAGRPFTEAQISGAVPGRAGYMVAWNNIHRWTNYGYRSDKFLMCYMTAGGGAAASLPDDWGGRGNCERSMTMNFHRVYLAHVAMLPEQGYRIDVRDSERFLYKDVMRITDPFDVAGTAFMIERPLAYGEEDQVHSYLPGERRVRRLSSRERADAFLGSDFTLDDLEAWSGKVADYSWELVGSRIVLGVLTSQRPYSVFQGPLSDIPDDVWTLRDTWAVIATPTWKDHPYGARVMFFDKQTGVAVFTLVLDRAGRLWKILYPIYAWPGAPGGGDGARQDTALHWRSSVALDVLNRKSSVTRSYGTELPDMDATAVRRIFSASTLTGGR